MCWIKLVDQMPEVGEKVDIWMVRDGRSERITDAELGYFGNQIVFLAGFVILLSYVTHWRYPPAPPAGVASA